MRELISYSQKKKKKKEKKKERKRKRRRGMNRQTFPQSPRKQGKSHHHHHHHHHYYHLHSSHLLKYIVCISEFPGFTLIVLFEFGMSSFPGSQFPSSFPLSSSLHFIALSSNILISVPLACFKPQFLLSLFRSLSLID